MTVSLVLERNVARIADTFVQPGAGPSHIVRPVLEPGKWAEYDPFLLLMEDWFTTGTFGDHPHRGIETVTFVLEGELEHRDNHGGHGVLRPGDAQWMTAGRGLIHSEAPSSDRVHTLQLWVNLPAARKMAEPRYQDLRSADMPVWREDGVMLRVFSGASHGIVAPTLNHVPVKMIEMRLDSGASVVEELPARDNALIYVLEGSGRFGSDGTPAKANQVVWLSRTDEAGTSELTVRADESLRTILWSGEPLREPVAARGPFVMNTDDEIRQAYADYRTGRF